MKNEIEKQLFVVFKERYAGIPSLYAGKVEKETEKTIRLIREYDYTKPYHCYRTLINKETDDFIVVNSESMILEIFLKYNKARKEYEDAEDRFKNTVTALLKGNE